ncbi:MAG: uracil-DNA glycosylase, partial [Bacteroidota bacterium]
MTGLEMVMSDLGDCKRCDLHLTRTNLVFGSGSPTARVLFVGEAPGENEDLQGQPFVGQAGKMLDNLFRRSGLPREDCYIANVLKCRPPG